MAEYHRFRLALAEPRRHTRVNALPGLTEDEHAKLVRHRRRKMRAILLAAAFVAAALLALHVGAQTPQIGLPDVSVTAPITTTRPQPRDSMISKWRNEEDKFVEAPCGTTRLTATASNARCLVGIGWKTE